MCLDLLFFLLQQYLCFIQLALNLLHSPVAIFADVVQLLLHETKSHLLAAQFLLLQIFNVCVHKTQQVN